MPKSHPREFRDDVIAVARKGEAPIGQIAKDFGISESCLHSWLAMADWADAPAGDNRSAAEVREAKKRIRRLEQGNEVLRRAVAYLSRDNNPT